MKKIYSAFISSAFESLLDERKKVIDALLDFRILPIGMEHFTVSTSDEFRGIRELIDDSDFFILLMGACYGSTDPEGISWTHREYNYARETGKPIIVLLCDELLANLRKAPDELTEDARKQVAFAQSISYARAVSEDLSIATIISQFLHTYDFSRCIGWQRPANIHLNPAFHVDGLWHHVHLSEDDLSYIRVGTLRLEQDFSPDRYRHFRGIGVNYNVDYYDSATGTLYENELKRTDVTADYTLKENGEIFGVFHSTRSFKDSFDSVKLEKGVRRGIHDFRLRADQTETTRMEGSFHDEAPSPKHGLLYLFRSETERNEFLLKYRKQFIEVK